MLDMNTAAHYLTDRQMEFMLDVGEMWSFWNVAEFGGTLDIIPTYTVNQQTADMFFPGEKLETTRGSFIYEHDLPIESESLIVINTVLLAELHLDGSYVHSDTLYHKVAQTLLHEMVHQWCHQNGIVDHESDGTHNTAFRDAARAHGLTCHEGCQGWNHTYVRAGHWGPFYKLAKEHDADLAHKMRSTHITIPACEQARGVA